MNLTISAPSNDLDIVHLVLNASPIVQLVLLLLMVVSATSWLRIVQKYRLLTRISAQNEVFQRIYERGGFALQTTSKEADPDKGPMERIACEGDLEKTKMRDVRGLDHITLVDSVRRRMYAHYQTEMDAIEKHLSFLATVGSVSPYLGLFGTVWGIMHAFTGLASLSQVTLASVAPGIAEALVATAIGLFSAIPAVIAYNRLSNDAERIANKMEGFIEKFAIDLHTSTQASINAERQAQLDSIKRR